MSIQLQIITPEYIIYEGEVEAVTVPGKGGKFQMLENHAPIVASLENGTVRIKATKEAKFKHKKLKKAEENCWNLEVTGGVMELQNNFLTIFPD